MSAELFDDGVRLVLRTLIIAVALAIWAGTGTAAPVNKSVGGVPQDAHVFARLAQDGGANPRMLAPPAAAPGSDWQAAKAARACVSGGTVLRVDPNGQGYDVRVLVANQVKVVRIDASGHCR